jgi:hypothetical protein
MEIELDPVSETYFLVKNAVFWDVTTCGSCKNRRFGGTYRVRHHSDRVTSSPILVTLLMEGLGSSKPSILKRAALRNIPENGILRSHRCGNLKPYTFF